MTPGNVDKKKALLHIANINALSETADELVSPLGDHNYPNYATRDGGRGATAPALDVECAYFDVKVRDSDLPPTKDGPSGRELVTLKSVKKGAVIVYYWGEFLYKKSGRYRRMLHGKCTRLMTMSELPLMVDFCMLGHHNCAATYIQDSQYRGPDQKNVKANVEFVEQSHADMSPLAPHKYISVVAKRDIKANERLVVRYKKKRINKTKAATTTKKRKRRSTRSTGKSKTKKKKARTNATGGQPSEDSPAESDNEQEGEEGEDGEVSQDSGSDSDSSIGSIVSMPADAADDDDDDDIGNPSLVSSSS